MDLSDLHIEKFIGEIAGPDLYQKVLVFTFAWHMVKGTIKKHFQSIENNLANVAASVDNLKHAVARVEQNHSDRLTLLEDIVKTLTVKVMGLEKREK